MWTVLGHVLSRVGLPQCVCVCVVFSEHWGFLGKLLHPLYHPAWKILTFYDDSAPLILKLAVLRQRLCPQLCGLLSSGMCRQSPPPSPPHTPAPPGGESASSFLSLSHPSLGDSCHPWHKESLRPALPRPPPIPGVPLSFPVGWRPESLPQLNMDTDDHCDLRRDSSG